MNKRYFIFVTAFLVTACGPAQTNVGQFDVPSAGQVSGVQWLERAGKYAASDSTYPVGKYIKTLSLERTDYFNYACAKHDPDTKECVEWRKYLSEVQVDVKYIVKENNFVSKDISGRLSFTPEGLLKEKSGDGVILSNAGELLIREYWVNQPGGDASEKLLHQEDHFRVVEGTINGTERLFDEHGEKMIYEHEMPFLPMHE